MKETKLIKSGKLCSLLSSYVSPKVEVYQLEVESPILNSSQARINRLEESDFVW